MIAIANFWASEDFDFGFDEWKRRISAANPRVALLPCACDNVSSGASKVCTTTLGALKGWADNAYSLGADGLYVFNAAYMPDDVQRELYGPGLSRSPFPIPNAAMSSPITTAFHRAWMQDANCLVVCVSGICGKDRHKRGCV